MLKKFLYLAAFLSMLLVFITSAFATSDADYKKLMKNSAFAKADKALNAAWKAAKQNLSDGDFASLKKEQRAWIRTGRDETADALMQDGLSMAEAYTQVTNERADYITQLVNSGGYAGDGGDEDEWEDIPDNSGTSGNNNDLPDDVPGIQPDSQQDKPGKAAKKINLTNTDEASEFLMSRLDELGRVSPGEELSDLESVTDINGEQCYEFALMFNAPNIQVESGRYAVSPSGKIYELEDGKYVPAK